MSVRAPVVARHYADTLYALAERRGGSSVVDDYGAALELVVGILEDEPRVREFLETPRIPVDQKREAVRTAVEGRVPEHFLRFLMVVIEKRRATLLRGIRDAYRDIVDEARGRVRADVALARPADDALRSEIVESLQKMLQRQVIASFRVDRGLLGGVVVRVGDRILDGSIRRRADGLRRQLLAARLPSRNGTDGAAANGG